MIKTIVDKPNTFYDKSWTEWNEFVKLYPASIHRRRYILKELAKVSEWKSIADFGCGNAVLLLGIFDKYRNSHKDFTGIDVSDEQIKKNQKNYPQINFEAHDFSKSIPGRTYDVITSSEVIEHIADYRSAIRNIANSLNPNGTCIITVPSGKIFKTEIYFGHLHHFTEQELINEFRNVGIEPTKCWSWGFPFHNLTKYLANINTDKTIANFAKGDLSISSKLVFHLVNFAYYFNVFPFGKQIYYVGRKVPQLPQV